MVYATVPIVPIGVVLIRIEIVHGNVVLNPSSKVLKVRKE